MKASKFLFEGQRFTYFAIISTIALGAVACSVYGGENPIDNGPGAGGSGGSAGIGGSGGAGGIGSDASTTGGSGGVLTGGSGGSTGGSGGNGSTGGTKGGSGGSGGATGGTGGTPPGDASGGSGGATGGTGGAGGTMVDAGTGGAAGATGTGGAAGTGGATGGTGGATGGTGGATGGTGGATGGTGGAGGDSGSGGSTGGTAGTAGATGGTGGTMDAGPEAPPPPGAVFATGSFSKSGSTGSQSVAHGLGQVPKALILWTIGKTNESLSSGFYYGIGISDSSAGYAIATTARDGVSPAWAIRRIATSKAMLMIGTSGSSTVVLAEANVPSLSASNFTLNWTTNDGQPSVVHYLAIGGPQVTAKVVHWQAPGAPGTRTVSGIGFQPEAVLHFYPGWGYDEAPGANVTNAVIGLGAMDKTGAQWAIQAGSVHNESPAVSSRAQRNDSAFYSYTDTGPAVTKDAKFVSMNADGFTLNFTTANSAASHVFSLALGGLRASVGTFNKTTGAAPASQSVPSGFRPGALLLASYQTTAQTSGTSVSTGSFGLGVSDGTNEASSAVVAADNVSTAAVDGIDKTSKVFLKMNTPPLDAEADLASFDPTGFTLNWTTNDSIATQICFLALGAR